MSKTFKDAKAEMDSIEVVCDYDGEPYFYITTTEAGNMAQIRLDNSTAPAFALSILESSGADTDLRWSGAKGHGNADHLGWIAWHLGAYIKTQERATAEAKDKAKLEAEALTLLNAVRDFHSKPCIPWEETHEDVREEFLAIARKAREMSAEK